MSTGQPPLRGTEARRTRQVKEALPRLSWGCSMREVEERRKGAVSTNQGELWEGVEQLNLEFWELARSDKIWCLPLQEPLLQQHLTPHLLQELLSR